MSVIETKAQNIQAVVANLDASLAQPTHLPPQEEICGAFVPNPQGRVCSLGGANETQNLVFLLKKF